MIKSELLQLQPIYEYIDSKVASLQTEKQPESDIKIVVKKLSKLKLYWSTVEERAQSRESVITVLLPASEKWYTTRQKFVAQKSTVEQKMNAIQPVPADDASLRKQHSILQVTFNFNFRIQA